MLFDVEIPNAREGVSVPIGSIGPADIAELAVLAERLGYDALWANDFITPTPCYGIQETGAPAWHEPFITLAYIAGMTKAIKLGTAVIMAPFRDPIIMAKQVATLDQLSGGRMLLGLGIGMCRDELETVRPRDNKIHRGRHFDEFIQVTQRLLEHSDQPVAHTGEYVEFQPLQLDPKPVNNGVPIYLSGRVTPQLERIAKFGLNLMIRAGSAIKQVKELTALMESAGRDPASADVVIEIEMRIESTREKAIAAYAASHLGKIRTEVRGMAMDGIVADNWIGTADDIAAKIDAFAKVGIRHFSVLNIASDSVADRREQMQAFSEQVIARYRK